MAPPPAAPPPLDPPPAVAPSTGPIFLKHGEELDPPPERERPPRRTDEPYKLKPAMPRDFVLNQTPWVDFSLTNFWMDERSSNFLNLGVQVGAYFFQRMRVAVRMVAPLEEASDDHANRYLYDGVSSTLPTPSRSIAVLYGASVGLILSNSKTFLFAPGLLIMRTDVNDYGTTGSLSLPFEWTTERHLRVGFELALGHAFGGYEGYDHDLERHGGTAVLLQYSMGFAMGHY